MYNLRNMLLQEEQKLKDITRKLERSLEIAPEGKLRLSRCGDCTQYYLMGNQETSSQGRKYLPKSEMNLIRRLAQKDYDEKMLKLVTRRMKQIQKITKDYEDDELEKLYLTEHQERRKLVQPVEPTWEQQLTQWISQPYEGKGFADNIPVLLTKAGERVRSKSEKILADYFYNKGIPYKYECPLYLPPYGAIYPDFTFLSPKTGNEIYWEHEGRIDKADYAMSAVKKIELYETNHIYPGERLILTFETEQTTINMRIVEQMVDKYLV